MFYRSFFWPAIFTVLLFIPVHEAYAQVTITGSITGRVIDETDNPVPYAVISLKNESDPALFKTAFTDNGGTFNFTVTKTGNYFLEVRMMGFQNLIKGKITMTGEQSVIDIGRLRLVTATKILKSVTVNAQKQLIERRADKITINLNDAISAGSSVNEVLNKLPGVTVSPEGQISLNGQGIQIFINGKPTPLSTDALSGLLRGMPAAGIEKIELIAHPSAKYDASGGSGIINLVKKRNYNEGLSGNIYGGIGQAVYGKHNAGLNLNYKNRSINILLNPNYSFNKYFIDSRISTDFFNGQKVLYNRSFSDITSVRINHTYSPNIGIDFLLSNKTTISLSAAKEIQQLDRTSLSAIQTYDAGLMLSGSSQFTNQAKTKTGNFTSGIRLQHKIDSAGKEYTIDLDYFNYLNRSGDNYSIENYTGNLIPLSQSVFNQDRGFNVYSAKADYTLPLKGNARFELGWKSSYVTSGNSSSFYNFSKDRLVLDITKNDNFKYQENINAVYASYGKDQKKTAYNLGLRTENTWGKGQQFYTGETFIRKYIRLFPSAFLTYKFNKNNELNLTAKRYINRPSYENLNPLIRIINSTNYTQGNPNLAPAIGYSLSLTHSFRNALFTAIDYNRITGDFTFLSMPYTDQAAVTTKPLNNSYTQYIRFITAFNKQANSWWFTSSNISLSQRVSKGTFEDLELNTSGILSFNADMYNSFKLTRNFTFLILVKYAGKSQDRNLTIDPYYLLTAGISQNLFNKKATLSFNVTDIFNSYRSRYIQNSLSIYQLLENTYETRVAKLSFSYNFGGNIRKTKTGNSAEDEKIRTGLKEN